MKKTLVWLALLLLFAVPVWAADPIVRPKLTGSSLPTSGEIDVWELIGSTWTKIDKGDKAKARLFESKTPVPSSYYSFSGDCNQYAWHIYLQNWAEVAHWCRWIVDYNKWDWRILKPGEYAADCIELKIDSNGPVSILGSSFTNLTYYEWEGEGAAPEIPVWYTWSSKNDVVPVDSNSGLLVAWKTPDEINDADPWLGLNECAGCSEDAYGWVGHLWNKILVKKCQPTCNYRSWAEITIALDNQKMWVDADGTWSDR
jgi:hypothetical protein